MAVGSHLGMMKMLENQGDDCTCSKVNEMKA